MILSFLMVSHLKSASLRIARSIRLDLILSIMDILQINMWGRRVLNFEKLYYYRFKNIKNRNEEREAQFV